MWLSKFFKPKKVSHMNIFTQEYLDSLVAEHKLLTASLNRMTQNAANTSMYAGRYGATTFDAARTSMIARKLELEVKIDELMDFLN